MDEQRGDGVFVKSLRALHKLNAVGSGTTLPLSLVYNPIGPKLPRGCVDPTIKLWLYTATTLLRSLTGIVGLPRSISISPNGKLLATDGRDRAVRVFWTQSDE